MANPVGISATFPPLQPFLALQAIDLIRPVNYHLIKLQSILTSATNLLRYIPELMNTPH